MNKLRSKLEQNLGWVLLAVLLAGCLVVLRPFVSALLWAVVLSFSIWPIYRRLLRLLGNRRTLAALVMTLGMVLTVLLPFLIVGLTLADNVKELTQAVRHWIADGPPAPPTWLAKVPMLGQPATEYWHDLATDTAKLWAEAQRFIEPVSSWLLKAGLALGAGVIELALSIFIAFFLFRDGVAVGQRLTAAVERIGGERGAHLLTVAGKTAKTGSTRHIPLNAIALKTLKAWKDQSKESLLVFPSSTGTGKVFDNVKKSWKALLAVAKVESFRWHDMRHDFASKLVMAGIPLNTVRELLGHSDLKMTLRYAHLAPKQGMEAVEVLARSREAATASNVVEFKPQQENA